jgi:monoamine oxidase
MKVAVLGGGVSGLYTAFELCKRKTIKSIDLYEASCGLGGRIFTMQSDGVYLEGGAGRFNKKHRLFWKLIKELGIVKDVIELPKSKKAFIKDGKLLKEFSVDKILKSSCKKLELKSKEFLESVTFEEALSTIHSKEELHDIISSFGYDGDITKTNALNAIEILKRDFLEDNTYYIMGGGMKKVIDGLVMAVQSSRKVKIHLNSSKDPNELLHKYDKIIDCTNNPNVGNAIAAPLARVYAKFPNNKNGEIWFSDVGRFSTNNNIRQFIPIKISDGIAMASYCSDKWALYWNKMTSELAIKRTLLANLRKTFPNYTIPQPIWVKLFYWDVGTHYWPPNPEFYKANRKDRVYYAGERFSRYHHGWIEGSLESCMYILNKMPK